MRLESLNATTTVEFSNTAAHIVQKHPNIMPNSRGFSYNNSSSSGGHSHRGGRGHFSTGGGRNSFYSRTSKPMCQICGKTGHTALKCYHIFDLSYQNQRAYLDMSSSTSADSLQQSQAYIASPTVVNDNALVSRQWSNTPCY